MTTQIGDFSISSKAENSLQQGSGILVDSIEAQFPERNTLDLVIEDLSRLALGKTVPIPRDELIANLERSIESLKPTPLEKFFSSPIRTIRDVISGNGPLDLNSLSYEQLQEVRERVPQPLKPNLEKFLPDERIYVLSTDPHGVQNVSGALLNAFQRLEDLVEAYDNRNPRLFEFSGTLFIVRLDRTNPYFEKVLGETDQSGDSPLTEIGREVFGFFRQAHRSLREGLEIMKKSLASGEEALEAGMNERRDAALQKFRAAIADTHQALVVLSGANSSRQGT